MRRGNHPLWARPQIDYAAVRSHILTAITDARSLDHKKLCEEMKRLHGHSGETVRRGLRFLKEDGYVEQDRPGQPWRVKMR